MGLLDRWDARNKRIMAKHNELNDHCTQPLAGKLGRAVEFRMKMQVAILGVAIFALAIIGLVKFIASGI
jgi:hypothetical protein